MTLAEDVIARLEALIEATPPPPRGAEPEEVIEVFEAMSRARAAILADLATLAQGAARLPPVQALMDELSTRDRTWMAALVQARSVVADRMVSVAKARRAR